MRIHPTVLASGLVAVALAGCVSQEDALARCLVSTEPTVLLRVTAAPPEKRKAYDSCASSPILGLPYCQALYFDANGLARECMRLAGYTFIDADFYAARGLAEPRRGGSKLGVCGFQHFRESACYKQKWVAEIAARMD